MLNHTIHHSARFPNIKALMWDNTKLYAARGYNVYSYDTASISEQWNLIGRYNPNLSQRACEYSKTLARIKRSGFHHLTALGNNELIGIIDKALVKLPADSKAFRKIFSITRGTRPLSLTTNPEGHIFWGEYFSNPARDPVNIYASYDLGESWSIAYTFPKSAIRHIHNIIWDQYINSFWIFTGDEHNECLIMTADKNMDNLKIVFQGKQQIRCVAGIPRPEGLYFASDTPFEANHIYLIEQDGSLNPLSPMPSSSLSACNISNILCFSSAVEPSSVNKSKSASLVISSNGQDWDNVVKWDKSMLPSKLFQFANISLPTGYNSSSFLAATGISVKKEHMTTHLWEIKRK